MADKPNVVELDVRPHLKQKLEPFQVIMDTVNELKPEDTFILHATFKPTPLLGVMKVKGYTSNTEKIDSEHYIVTFIHQSREDAFQEDSEGSPTRHKKAESNESGPQVYELDNRGLEPPQPMVRTLNQLEKCAPGDKVIIHNDRVPVFLIDELNTLGYAYTIDNQVDGTAKVTISKS